MAEHLTKDERAAFGDWFTATFIKDAPQGNVWLAWQAGAAWQRSQPNRSHTTIELKTSKPMRYRIQQDKGDYCLKGCADGDLMDYAEHAHIVERLQALLSCAYQLAGFYDAPVRFLDAFALHDEYTRMTPDQIIDKLLPITGDETTAR